ncbi:MAG: hypothetical protein IKP28_01205 [Clostridia bacterium]|nr:hypothetical protein [Clostridia bacterium]
MDEQNNEGIEYEVNVNGGVANGTANNGTVGAGLPQQVSVWSKIKSFLLQDVNRDIVVTMTPHQEKVLREVHDFWFQEINFGKVKDFLFQDITLGLKK